jgi:two-component system OmpR family sensor kinase
VADASHELRTPLTAIRGYAELYRRSADDPVAVATAMDRIEHAATRMGGLVDDLVLLARLDEGRPLDARPVDLARLVTEAVTPAPGSPSACREPRPTYLPDPGNLPGASQPDVSRT